ncbi:MAG TPA: M1 family metallopeptidase [Candidatus Aminicenantes bacterium]|nr:M1 family metallopeptidase [Candidatus Aminicenantes bacterium]HRY65185.1 M1 family metallopeptidase [Candidatus Aminicenantes bacterium]HRZ72347.1 M1 family metallopeptidase [Candidatus Aminicenantes bacterium]
MTAKRTASFCLAALAALAVLPAAAAAQTPPAPVAGAPGLRYEIWVELDPAAKMLLGREEIVWTNPTRDAVPDMLLHLYWNAFKNEASAFMREAAAEAGDRAAVDPQDDGWGWIDVTDIRLADGSDLKPAFAYVNPDGPETAGDQTVARVLFPTPVRPGESVRLRIEFKAKAPRTVARSGYYKDSFFLGQWYPKPGVYEEGKGWNCHAYHRSSEFFADFADFVVHITVPKGYVVGSSGKAGESRADDSARTTTTTYRQAMVHDFAWMADPRYLKIERDFIADREVTASEYRETADLLGLPVEEVRLPDVKMTLLIAPEHKGQIERHFRALRAAIKYYGLWYGPYPYETVTMVDPPYRTGSGGMEYPTLFTAGTRVLANRDVLDPEGVIVHEFGHGYWYGLAANNEFEAAWLDEGFNTYSTGRVMARAYGPGAIPLVFKGIPLSSVLRVPKIFDFETSRVAAIHAVRTDPVTAWSWEFFDSMSYSMNVYMRAATLLGTLENLLGDPLWSRIMRTYHMRFRFRHPTKADFVAVVNEISGRDMTWFFDELLEGTQAFDYGVESLASVEVPARLRGVFDKDGAREVWTDEKIEVVEDAAAKSPGSGPPARSYRTTVALKRYGEARLGGDAKVEVVVRFADGSAETRTWDGRDRWTRLEFVKPVKAVSAQIDPRGVWLIDENLANNSRSTDGLRRNVVKLMTRFLFGVQCVLQFFGSWS